MLLLPGVLVMPMLPGGWEGGEQVPHGGAVSALFPLAARGPWQVPERAVTSVLGWQRGDAVEVPSGLGWSSFPSTNTHTCRTRHVVWLVLRSSVRGKCVLSSSIPPPALLFHNPDSSGWGRISGLGTAMNGGAEMGEILRVKSSGRWLLAALSSRGASGKPRAG